MKTIKYFRKKLHLRCSTGFCMYPWNLLTFCNFFIALKKIQNIALKLISDSEHVYFQVSILESLLPAISDRNTSECKSDRIRDATSFCPVCGRTSWISKNISIIDIITIIVTDKIRIWKNPAIILKKTFFKSSFLEANYLEWMLVKVKKSYQYNLYE